MDRQTDAVRAAIGRVNETSDVPVIPVVCFIGGDNRGLLDPPFTIGDVHVLWARELRKLLRRPGPLDGAGRTKLARLLSTQLTPASRGRQG